MLAGVASARTLHDALNYTYFHNPALQSVRAAERAAQTEIRAAKGQWFPHLSLETGLGRDNLTGSTNIFPGFSNFAESLDQSYVRIRLDQPIYEGGGIGASVEAAQQNASASHAQTRAKESTVLLQAIRAYLNVVTDKAKLKVQQDNARVLRKQLQAATNALENGEGTDTEVAEAKARLEGALATIISAKSALAQARAHYTSVIGRAPQKLAMPTQLPELPNSLTQAQTLASQNYQVIAARFSAQAAHAQISEAESQFKPKLGVFAEYQKANNPEFGFTNLTDREYGLTLSIPIYQGGVLRAKAQAARERAQQSQLAAASAEHQAQDEVAAAWQNYMSAHSSLSAIKAQISAAETAYRGVSAAHAQGERTLLDVLNTLQELRNARLSLVKAKRNQIIAAYSLLGAIGQLNARTLKLSKPMKLKPNHS